MVKKIKVPQVPLDYLGSQVILDYFKGSWAPLFRYAISETTVEK